MNNNGKKSGEGGMLKGGDDPNKDEFCTNVDLDNLKLEDLISRGRYATVWKGNFVFLLADTQL